MNVLKFSHVYGIYILICKYLDENLLYKRIKICIYLSTYLKQEKREQKRKYTFHKYLILLYSCYGTPSNQDLILFC